MNILLYEPLLPIRKAIQKTLRAKGYNVACFDSLEKSLEAIDNGYSFFILEMSTSPQKSLALLKSIKDFYPCAPVVMLHLAHDIEVDTLKKAYSLGCDDLIKKPFIADELEIKCSKLLNIRHDVVTLAPQCTLDFTTGLLHTKNRKSHLSKKEKRLFSILFSHKETLVSFETIKSMVWEGECVSLDSIRSLIRRLRQKMPFNCIETIIDAGYTLRLQTTRAHTTARLQPNQMVHEAFCA